MKLMHKEFRGALRGEGDLVEVLTESLGDKTLARFSIAYLAIAAEEKAFEQKVFRWFYFALGAATTLAIGGIVKVFA